MADQKELDRMNRVAEFINRYYEFEDAVDISKQNKEYLKTYIHDESFVVENYKMKEKIIKSFGFIAIVAAAMFIVLFFILGSKLWIASAIVAGALFLFGMFFTVTFNKLKLKAAKQEQVEVNSGIKEQIQVCESRTKQLEKQRDDYRKGLEKRLDFITPDYIGSIDTLKGYLVNGEAETCEDAVSLLEQNMLMKKMNDLMNKSSRKPLDMDFNEAREKFGDPLAIIKEKKKKKK